MRISSALLLVAVVAFAAVQVIRGSSTPASGEAAGPAQPVAQPVESYWNPARKDSLRRAHEEELRRATEGGHVATFQPQAAPAQPAERTYSEEELAACSAVPLYGADGYIVGYSANPDCKEYRRTHPRGRAPVQASLPSPFVPLPR